MKETITINEYELSHENGLNFKCKRHGEEWRDLVGDGMVLAMFQHIRDLEEYSEGLAQINEDLLLSEGGL